MSIRRRSDPNFKNPTPALSSSTAPQNLKFEREDWTVFRTIEGLQQKAGVAKSKLTRLVLKELADNALDTGAATKVGPLPSGGFYVEDAGAGIDGAPGVSPTCSRSADRWSRPNSGGYQPVARLAMVCVWLPGQCWRPKAR